MRYQVPDSRKIKIFVDAHVFDSSYQGTTTYIKGLYCALVEDDRFEITLAARNIEHLRKEFNDERFNYIQLVSSNKIVRLWSEIPRLLRTDRFHFAHFQYITPLRKNTLFINTIHDLLFLDFPEYFPVSYRVVKKFLFKASARRSDILFTVSRYSRDAISRHFQIGKNRVFITPNAISPGMRASYRPIEEHNLRNYLLFVSRLEPRKNHLLMLRSFCELGLYTKGYQLVFVGRLDDVKTNAYWNYFEALGSEVKKSIFHLENLAYEELQGLYENAALFVYPSLAEGFGIPPLEAAMAGCKVLCSNLTAMQDFDFFGDHSFDPRDESGFRAKLVDTLHAKDYPHAAIKAAINERYNWSTIAREYASVLIQRVSSK